MNTITHAFKQSGVKLPTVNKRIWLWLNDHPGKTAKEVAMAIGVRTANVSSGLAYMTRRKMVSVTLMKRPYTDRMLRSFSTCIKEYELLPAPLPVAGRQPTPTLVEQPKPTVMPPAVPKPLLGVLENYTLKELRVIRDGLNTLFEHV